MRIVENTIMGCGRVLTTLCAKGNRTDKDKNTWRACWIALSSSRRDMNGLVPGTLATTLWVELKRWRISLLSLSMGRDCD
jgi:hypothetical protein